MTAYRPYPNLVKRARARVRGSSAEDSGSGLGLERGYILYALGKNVVFLVLDTCCYCGIQYRYEKKQHNTKHNDAIETAPSTCHGHHSFHARCCLSACSVNSARSLSASALIVTASAAQG